MVSVGNRGAADPAGGTPRRAPVRSGYGDGGGCLDGSFSQVSEVQLSPISLGGLDRREAPDDSALNHVRAPISSAVQIGNRVRVQVGGLVAEVTTTSVERLAREEGEAVVATFKAAATRLVPRV
jgi:hypothetical protein